MEQLLQQIENYKQEVAAFAAGNADEAEAFLIKFLGTKGIVKSVMGEMRNVPNENKKEFGLILNAFKVFTEEKFEKLKQGLSSNGKQATANIDWSLPGEPVPAGTRHPLSIVRNQMVSIFKRLGFAVAEGPEIED